MTQPTGAEVGRSAGAAALPGLIDVHAHLREPGGEHKEDFYTGTAAALAGGVTTVLGMPNTRRLSPTRLHSRRRLTWRLARPCVILGCIVGATREIVQTAAAVENAVGLKMYMGSSTGNLLVDRFEDQYAHMLTIRATALWRSTRKTKRPCVICQHKQRRPPLCANLETARAIQMAQSLERTVHICHLSTAQEIAWSRRPRSAA